MLVARSEGQCGNVRPILASNSHSYPSPLCAQLLPCLQSSCTLVHLQLIMILMIDGCGSRPTLKTSHVTVDRRETGKFYPKVPTHRDHFHFSLYLPFSILCLLSFGPFPHFLHFFGLALRVLPPPTTDKKYHRTWPILSDKIAFLPGHRSSVFQHSLLAMFHNPFEAITTSNSSLNLLLSSLVTLLFFSLNFHLQHSCSGPLLFVT